MKMKDMVLIEHPEKIKKDSCGGVFGCPHWYGLEKNPPTNCKFDNKSCKKCWNRKYDPKVNETTVYEDGEL